MRFKNKSEHFVHYECDTCDYTSELYSIYEEPENVFNWIDPELEGKTCKQCNEGKLFEIED